MKRIPTQGLSRRGIAAAVLTCLCASAAIAQTTSTPMSQDERMKWFREAKFGLFIHWGLYCIPAGEWKGEPIALLHPRGRVEGRAHRRHRRMDHESCQDPRDR